MGGNGWREAGGGFGAGFGSPVALNFVSRNIWTSPARYRFASAYFLPKAAAIAKLRLRCVSKSSNWSEYVFASSGPSSGPKVSINHRFGIANSFERVLSLRLSRLAQAENRGWY